MHVVHAHYRPQKIFLKIARQGRDTAHPQALHFFAAAGRERGHQFVPERKNMVGVAEHFPAPFGQLQGPPFAGEQLVPHLRFQLLDLRRQGRLRHVHLFGHAREVTFLGDHPKIIQVTII